MVTNDNNSLSPLKEVQHETHRHLIPNEASAHRNYGGPIGLGYLINYPKPTHLTATSEP